MEAQHVTDRVPLAEKSARHTLVQNQDPRSALPVGGEKFPAREQWNAHGLEIIGADPVARIEELLCLAFGVHEYLAPELDVVI